MSLAEAAAGKSRLVGCGTDELWYEDLDVANGTMTKLVASDDDIDTSDNLTLIPAFGKVIVLNGTNKKVYDPINSKIVTAAVGTHPPDPGTELTGGTSGAKMTVDYITSLADACTIYGFRTTTATFTTGETVTGTDDDGNAISFAMTAAAEVAPPHWYDLTPFGNSATFGTLPSKLYLGAVFLGRLYVGGDPNAPLNWQASRQGGIYDFLNNQEDVQSACAGGDVEFGKLQDIPRAYIPYENDYIIFGCYSSMYALIGDPMQGGSAKRVSDKVGVFGSKSWCFDDAGNLYWWGTGGIYRMPKGLGPVEHLTEYRLPNIVYSEGVDPSTHRIILEWDVRRHGLQVSIVNLSTSVNSCYWYEKRTDGFYPELYPEQCSAYSMLYYDSPTTAQRDLLWGCADGYIRQPLEAAEDDDIGGSDEAIDSYVTFGPFIMGERLGDEGIIGGVSGILGGGATGGTQTDSSSVTYYVYVGDSPEQVIERVDAGTYVITGTVHGPGYQRGKKQLRNARGKFAAIRLRNNTAAQTWAFEEIEVEVMPVGRLA